MANPVEKSFSVPKISDIQAIILKSVSNSQKWEKFQKTLTLQPIKNQTPIERSQENRNDIKELPKANKDVLKISEENKLSEGTNLDSGIFPTDIVVNDHFPESFITSKSEKTECHASKVVAKNLKKPFLRKRSGLLRYAKKPVSQSETSKKVFSGIKETTPYESSLKPKPLMINGTSTSQTRHVHFAEPEFHYSNKIVAETILIPKDINEEYSSKLQTIPANNSKEENNTLNCRASITKQITVDNIESVVCNSALSEDTVGDISKSKDISDTAVEKSAFRNKIEELEKEINIYQKQNARLSEKCKEDEEILRKLKEEYDGIGKFKEDQKENLKIEMENEKHQLKKEKETFQRYQKLKRDNPTRKEQKELIALKEELKKLQEEQKQLRIKFAHDNKRMKSQLIETGKERDSLKLKSITLEGQQKDLTKALKVRVSKTKKSDLLASGRSKPDSIGKNLSDKLSNKFTNLQTNKRSFSKKSSNIDRIKTDSTLKPRVHFSFNPQLEISTSLIIENEDDSDKFESDTHKEPSKILNEDARLESTSLPKELSSPDKVEKLYPSGDREITFPSGNKKFISASDGTTIMTFHNGDVLEMYPDKGEIYKYANGMVEKSLPCGTKITEFPNGQIEHDYPSGLKEVVFPNGTLHCIYNDGSEVIKANDGTKATVSPDGTEVIEKLNGEKEIRTANYKRREFPDGSVRILYTSGKMETRYPNGRIKVKDKNGRIILDTKHCKD